LRTGEDYQAKVVWQAQAAGKVVVRLLPDSGVNVQATDLQPLLPGETERTISVPQGVTCARILIFGKDSPASICKHVALSSTR